MRIGDTVKCSLKLKDDYMYFKESRNILYIDIDNYVKVVGMPYWYKMSELILVCHHHKRGENEQGK